jgi:hypothetical protein
MSALASFLRTETAPLPSPGRRGRPCVADSAAERRKHIECAGLMLGTNWPLKKICAALEISRATAYLWRDLALGYGGPEADALRRLRDRRAFAAN